MSGSPHERSSGSPAPASPTNTGGNLGDLKLTPVITQVALIDGIIIIGLEPTLKIKLFDLEGDPVREILTGTRLKELERILGYRYEVYGFRVKGWCIEATGQRFRIWCRELAEYLNPSVNRPYEVGA